VLSANAVEMFESTAPTGHVGWSDDVYVATTPWL
jgi:hypothetical protein